MRQFYFCLSFLSLLLWVSCSTTDEPQAATQANENIPPIAWSQAINGLGSLDVTLDDGGAVHVSGDYTGTPGVDGLPQVTVGIRNGFFLKYDANGNTVSVMDLGWQIFQDLNYMTLGSAGRVILAGRAVDFQNVMFLEVDPTTETQVLNRSIAGSGNDRPAGIARDPEGNIILGGRFNGTVRLENGDNLFGAILGSAALVKYNASGEVQWSFLSPAPSASSMRGLDVDPSGNVYCYECVEDLIYLRKLSPEGELLFTREDLGRCGYGLKVVSDQEIYLNTVSDVIRMDGEGSTDWTLTTTTQLWDVDATNGQVVVAGRNFSGGQFGSVELPGRSDTFMALLTSDGRVQWVTTEQGATDISMNASGDIAFANVLTGVVGTLEP